MGIRTNYRLEEVRLYRLQKVIMEKAHALSLSYLKGANALRTKAEWCDAVTANCTTGIRHNVEDIGYARRWDWQILFNGYIAERAYELGAMHTLLPLPELCRLSLTHARARAGGNGPGFSACIREGLPGIPPRGP